MNVNILDRKVFNFAVVARSGLNSGRVGLIGKACTIRGTLDNSYTLPINGKPRMPT